MARELLAAAMAGSAALGAAASCASTADDPPSERAVQGAAASVPPTADGASAVCDQTLIPYPLPPATANLIAPRSPIVPFYQWENNDGYCGEVSMMQAAMNSGQWMSQFDARLLCGASTSVDGGLVAALQSGPDGFCEAHGHPYEFAQLLFTCKEGCAAAPTCLGNARLAHESYETPSGQSGMTAYEGFLSWVKGKVIAGEWVTVGIQWHYGKDDEYDHIVAVTGVGTNHSPTDATYYADDVLSFDDHGLYTFKDGKLANNPAVPLGAGSDTAGCTPYVFSDTFDDLSRGRSDMKNGGKQPYAFPLPKAGVKNFAFAVKGPLDGDGETLPVVLRLTQTKTRGADNPEDPRAGYDYEAPFIGTSKVGRSCTNTPPASWMNVTAEVTVSGLTSGTAYNLYEYVFDSVSGLGTAAALAVPTSAFNANAKMATSVTPFVASGATYAQSATFRSDQVVVFRAVPASAP